MKSEYLKGVTRFVGLDIETEDPDLKDRGPSWVWGNGRILVTGLYDHKTGKKKSIDGDGGNTTRKILGDPKVAVVGANLAYDIGWLTSSLSMKMEDVKAKLIDISIVESMIDLEQPYSLDALAWKYLKERKGADALSKIALDKGLKGDFRAHLGKLWDLGYKDQVRDYVISDADQPVRIWLQQVKALEAVDAWPAFDMNAHMLFITCETKQHGVRIDYPKWRKNCETVQKVHDELLEEFTDTYGYVNINSPKQLAELFDEHSIPYKYKIRVKGHKVEARKFNRADCFKGAELMAQRKAVKEHFPSARIEKGELNIYLEKRYVAAAQLQLSRLGYETTANPKIDKYALEAAQDAHPAAKAVAELKQVKNIITKFLGPKFERYLVVHNEHNVRLHGNFAPVGARKTGRLSAYNPNLQNIPSKTVVFKGTDKELNLATLCREVFIPDEGRMWLKLDFSGQENILQAHFAIGRSGEHIRAMYNENPRLDEHNYVTRVSGLGEKYGDKLGRKYAKNLRFGKSYGMQLARMMQQFGWDRETAEEIERLVQAASPWVYETMSYLQERLTGTGRFTGRQAKPWVKTLIGRYIYLPTDRKGDAYKFYNYLIQGSASDMTKMAAVKARATQTVERMLLTVHDENCYDLPISEEGFKRVQELQEIMQTCVELSVPITCDPELGLSWAHTDTQTKDDSGHPTETVLDFCRRVAVDGVLVAKNDEDDDLRIDDEDDTEDEEAS